MNFTCFYVTSIKLLTLIEMIKKKKLKQQYLGIIELV